MFFQLQVHYTNAQSGNRFCLSVCLSVSQSSKNIEIRPLRTVYGFKEHWNKRKTYLLPFLGAVFVHMAIPKISEVRPAYRNCIWNVRMVFKITESMHGVALYSQYNVVVYLCREKPSLSD